MKTNPVIVTLIMSTVIISESVGASCETPRVFKEMPQAQIRLVEDKREKNITARIADDPKERIAGYQHVCLNDALGTAVLFVFPYSVEVNFHMSNVYLPLDIVFFDSKGSFVKFKEMALQPERSNTKLYGSDTKIRFALELPAGSWRQLGFSKNVKLVIQ